MQTLGKVQQELIVFLLRKECSGAGVSSLVPPLCLLQDATMKVALLTVVKLLHKDHSLAYCCESKGDSAPCFIIKA